VVENFLLVRRQIVSYSPNSKLWVFLSDFSHCHTTVQAHVFYTLHFLARLDAAFTLPYEAWQVLRSFGLCFRPMGPLYPDAPTTQLFIVNAVGASLNIANVAFGLRPPELNLPLPSCNEELYLQFPSWFDAPSPYFPDVPWSQLSSQAPQIIRENLTDTVQILT
jgi:hypothetical protein